jgi:hypothetical protein
VTPISGWSVRCDTVEDKFHLEKLGVGTVNMKPLRQSPHRVSRNERQIIEEKATQMLDAEVIRSFRSPWVFPIELLPKVDKPFVLYGLYIFNSVTVENVILLPRITDIL